MLKKEKQVKKLKLLQLIQTEHDHLKEKNKIILEKWVLSKRKERGKTLVAYYFSSLNLNLLLENFSHNKKICNVFVINMVF